MYALCQLDSVLTLAVYGCSQSSPFVSWLTSMAEGCVCQLDSVLTLAVYRCSQSSPFVSWLRGVFKNVTLFGPYVADYGRGVCVCPLSVGLCSDFEALLLSVG